MITLLRWISILALGWRIVALLTVVITPAVLTVLTVLTVLVVLIRTRHDESWMWMEFEEQQLCRRR